MPKAQRSSTSPVDLLFADSDRNADMLYLGGVFVPDPFIVFRLDGVTSALVSQLEIARVGRESRFNEVLPVETWNTQGRKSSPEAVYPVGAMLAWLKSKRRKRVRVASDFPVGVADSLRAEGVTVEVEAGLFFPEREFKTDFEAQEIKRGNAASSAGFKAVEKILRKAEISRGFLKYQGRRLTSEFLQNVISAACLEAGAQASNTIVAGGDQACDPHCRGSGPLRANELIIVDIFPRLLDSGYHGDMTRTYLKGKASGAQQHLVHSVFEAQQWSLGEHKAGKSGRKIYREVRKQFEKAGYRTEKVDGTPVGFFHGLGHGLGLEVHEPPRVNPAGGRLRKGQVITVEPGLYYPGLGGCRIEDVVRVGTKGPEKLSSHSYRWWIR